MILSLAINENCQACFCWLTARRTWVRIHPVNLQTTALAIISRNPTVHSFAAACSFSREQNTVSTCGALTSPASPACPNSHSLLRHHSPAALLSRYLLTRFRALALFGRRSAERVVNSRRRRPKTCAIADIPLYEQCGKLVFSEKGDPIMPDAVAQFARAKYL